MLHCNVEQSLLVVSLAGINSNHGKGSDPGTDHRMKKNSIAAAALLAALSGAAFSEPAPSTAPLTRQQRFNAGGEALTNREWQKAYDIYSALESEFGAKGSGSKTLQIIRLRKGRAMAALQRWDEAEPAIAAALDALSDAPELAQDRHLAWMMLADIASIHFDYPLAVTRWHQAVDVTSDPILKVSGLVKAAPVAIFVDPAVALRDLDAAQVLVDSSKPSNKEWLGLIHNYRGRTLLNIGNLKAARAELQKSIKLFGGLSFRGDSLDVTARADAAIAALLDGDSEEARAFLAYAGASKAAEQGFARARDMSPPACDIPGLTPTDVAVIQFTILDDGSAVGVRPVYFSGQRSLAIEFARAVSRWSWSADQQKRLDPFFRAHARVELRCSNRFNHPRGADLLLPAVHQWLKQSGAGPSGVSGDAPAATRLPALRAELAQQETSNSTTSLAALITLTALAQNSATPWLESAEFARRAYDVAVANGAQGGPKAWFLLLRLRFDTSQWRGRTDSRYQRELAQALTDPTFVSDSRAEAALRLALFDSLSVRSRNKDGRAILEPLTSSLRFEKNDPFRVGALIRIANLDYAAGDVGSARTRFEQSGLTAQQCALADTKPIQTRAVGKYSFPEEAWRWGLGGWAVTEFDISAEGLPLNIRTIAAFPPFVFGADAESRIKIARYQQTYRPGSERGCVADNFNVNYFTGSR